jgi:hypothetical protein
LIFLLELLLIEDLHCKDALFGNSPNLISVRI